MGGSLQANGGIIGLAKFIQEHRKAIQSDLLRQTGYELEDVGRSLSWDALNAFLKFPGPDSALLREINPETADWAGQMKTNAILADIWDLLSVINANLVALGSGKPSKKPKQYPRPNKKEHDDEQRIGSGALPADQLRKWIAEKREQHAGHRKRHASRDSRTGGSSTEVNK